MVKYGCDKCGKEFMQKSHYDRHINKKNPCIQENKLTEIINNVVEKKIVELKNKVNPELDDDLNDELDEESFLDYSGDEIEEDTYINASIIKDDNKNINGDNIKLIHGDCLLEMKKIKSKSIDMILCDLPYGMTKNNWDIVIPFDKLWAEYDRIIKDTGAVVLFASQPFTSLLVVSNLKNFRYSLVWEKNKFSDFLNAKRKPMKTNEDICIFYKKQPTYNPQYWYSTPYKRWNTQNAVDKQTNYGNHKENIAESKDGKRLPTTVLKFDRIERPVHPTQKPVDLLEWLIKTYSNENDTVLDNCMGSGSTCIACKNTNRKSIGIELDETYFNIAKKRINENTII